MSILRSLCSLSSAVFLIAAVSSPTLAQQPIFAGLDLFQTDPAQTSFDFSSTPIPADFFGPGSDPFVGNINLQGLPLGGSTLCPNDDLGQADTIVRRANDANVPTSPSTDVIQIEIVELSLVSSAPIVVTYNGGMNPELWDVETQLSQSPQPQGSMTINRTHSNGGNFDTNLPVLPRFTFTRQSDSQIRILDFGIEAIPPVILNGAGAPWSDWNPPPGSCTSNWCPSPFVLNATNASHGVVSICPSASIPTLSTWMVILLSLLVIATGLLWLRRNVTVT